MAARKNLDEAGILKAVLTGRRHADVAAEFGCARSRVSQIALKNGYVSRAVRASKPVADSIPIEPARIGRPPNLELLPPWAAEVAEDYFDHLNSSDEFEAARHCRSLLRERRRAESIDARLGRAA